VFLREVYDGQLVVKLKKGINLPAIDPWVRRCLIAYATEYSPVTICFTDAIFSIQCIDAICSFDAFIMKSTLYL